ncbi:MAG: acyl carrier protein [Candidatus Tectimicrobiota bacterium]|nr:MAG: acyl carrier protein [Candidatus Tectomicrobia bacterium]
MEGLQPRLSRETILHGVVQILTDMTADWEDAFTGPIGPETRLVADLAFESIDVVQLAVAIEEHFQHPNLPFQKLLMRDGRYVEDLQVADLVEFLYTHLNGA